MQHSLKRKVIELLSFGFIKNKSKEFMDFDKELEKVVKSKNGYTLLRCPTNDELYESKYSCFAGHTHS